MIQTPGYSLGNRFNRNRHSLTRTDEQRARIRSEREIETRVTTPGVYVSIWCRADPMGPVCELFATDKTWAGLLAASGNREM